MALTKNTEIYFNIQLKYFTPQLYLLTTDFSLHVGKIGKPRNFRFLKMSKLTRFETSKRTLRYGKDMRILCIEGPAGLFREAGYNTFLDGISGKWILKLRETG